MPNFDTLFLDRDGVINVKLEGRYVRTINEFIFMPGAEQAIEKLSKIFNRILIITNQQGIGKGVMSEEELELLHNKMCDQINFHGGVVDKIYYCSHLANDNCSCRKPNTGMIKQAIIDFPDINIDESYLIGDSDSDIIAGRAMDLNTTKVDNDYTLNKWADELLLVI